MYKVFSINWKSSAIRCPHCYKPILFQPLYAHDTSASIAPDTAPPSQNSPSHQLQPQNNAPVQTAKQVVHQNQTQTPPAEVQPVKADIKAQVSAVAEKTANEYVTAASAKLSVQSETANNKLPAQTPPSTEEDAVVEDAAYIAMDNDVIVDNPFTENSNDSPYLITADKKTQHSANNADPDDTKFDENAMQDAQEQMQQTQRMDVAISEEETKVEEVKEEDDDERDTELAELPEDAEQEEQPEQKSKSRFIRRTPLLKKSRFTPAKLSSKKKINIRPSKSASLRKSSTERDDKNSKFDLILEPIKSLRLKHQASELIADIAGISIEDAEDLVQRKEIPVVSGIAKSEAEKYLAEFQQIEVNGRVIPTRD